MRRQLGYDFQEAFAVGVKSGKVRAIDAGKFADVIEKSDAGENTICFTAEGIWGDGMSLTSAFS